MIDAIIDACAWVCEALIATAVCLGAVFCFAAFLYFVLVSIVRVVADLV